MPLFALLLFSAGTAVLPAAPSERRGNAPRSAARAATENRRASAVPDDEEGTLYEGRENLPGKNFGADWPGVTRIPDMLPARTVQDGPDRWIYETQHFRFTADAPIALGAVKEIARIFEGTYAANLALPLNSPCNHYQVCDDGRFNAYLFKTYEGYLAAGGMKGSAGVFIGQTRIVLTHGETAPGVPAAGADGKPAAVAALEAGRVLVPFDSLGLEKRGNRYVRGGRRVDAKTLSHEITHHMTVGSYAYPIWFVEGLAEYVGLSYDGNGQVRFSGNKNVLGKYVLGYGEKGEGGRALGKEPQVGMTLQEFMTRREAFLGADSAQVGYGLSALLVYYFFHLDGKRDGARIKKYIEIIQNGGSIEQANAALLDGRSWDRLERDVSRRLKSVFKIRPQFTSFDS